MVRGYLKVLILFILSLNFSIWSLFSLSTIVVEKKLILFSLEKSLRRVKVSDGVTSGCAVYFEDMWQKTVQQSGIDEQRLQRFVRFFSGIPVMPVVSSDLNGATVVITLPENITAKAASVMDSIQQRLGEKISNLDEKFYLTPSDALHATVLVPEMIHLGPLSENAFSDNTVSVIKSLAEARGPFTMKIGAVNLTGNGVIILECYPQDNAVFELRDDLRKALPFASQRRHKQEVIHITLGRFLKQLSKEEFREVVDIISDFRNIEVGSFKVNELLYAHINAFGLEGRDRSRDVIIPLGE